MSCHDDANFMQNYENKQFIQIVSEKWLMLLAKKNYHFTSNSCNKIKVKNSAGKLNSSYL